MDTADSAITEANKLTADIRAADASYAPFPFFEDWKNCIIDSVRWDRYSELVTGRRDIVPDVLRKSREIVKRAAAMDTGAIEGLYDVDRGFTFTVATQAALWESALDKKGPEVRAFFESQLQAYDYVLDLATQNVPIGEAWIRTLHEQLCQTQKTYTAHTEIGIQQLPLPLGEYKHLPNHVRGRDGNIHSYAPVDLTPSEMHRLVEEMRSETFQGAHPAIQSAYAHYGFVCIHPFADGNGRVARALASVFMYRAQSVPLLILAENRGEYISALEKADSGSFQPFVDFIMERGLDAIRLVDQSIRAAKAPPATESLTAIKGLYVTKGGYSHKEVDQAGFRLVDLVKAEFNKQLAEMTIGGTIDARADDVPVSGEALRVNYRLPLNQARGVRLYASTDIPARSNIQRNYDLQVPIDAGRDDDIVLRNKETGSEFEARITELHPVATAALQMRISILVEGIIAEVFAELAVSATAALPRS